MTAGTVAKSLHFFFFKLEAEIERLGLAWAFEISKFTPETQLQQGHTS